MNKKSKYFFIIFSSTMIFLAFELIYLYNFKNYSNKVLQEKNSFVSVTSLPDLAISTEAMFIRHRSLSDIFSIFKESPELREYFPTTFIYSNSNILNNTPSKILPTKISNEK